MGGSVGGLAPQSLETGLVEGSSVDVLRSGEVIVGATGEVLELESGWSFLVEDVASISLGIAMLLPQQSLFLLPCVTSKSTRLAMLLSLAG